MKRSALFNRVCDRMLPSGEARGASQSSQGLVIVVTFTRGHQKATSDVVYNLR